MDSAQCAGTGQHGQSGLVPIPMYTNQLISVYMANNLMWTNEFAGPDVSKLREFHYKYKINAHWKMLNILNISITIIINNNNMSLL